MKRWFCIGVLSLALVGWVAPSIFGDDKASKSQETEKVAEAPKAKPGEAQQAKATEAREVKVTVNDLPSPVRRTLARESYGGEVKEVERETKAGKDSVVTTTASDGKVTAPLVLLTTNGTSGAAELFAAALLDNKRATLVGEHTLGRAGVQKLVKLPDGSFFDGGNGVMSEQALLTLYSGNRIEEMAQFDQKLLDQRSHGLAREYPECPNYSDRAAARIIANHLELLPSDAEHVER